MCRKNSEKEVPKMNRYYNFFTNMSDEEWEKFSIEILKSIGFTIETYPAYGNDGGKDAIVSKNGLTYLVSCKHYINSGKHVGQDDEVNISDRLLQFNTSGFIGVYSTGITTGLQNRLNAICKNGKYLYYIFSPQEIIHVMQFMDTKILQSYGLYPHKYYINVDEDEYKPLKCMLCGRDVLTDENIPKSLAGIVKRKDGTYDYAYGCKSCFFGVNLKYGAHLEIEQALHVKLLQGWENMVDEWIDDNEIILSEDFHKNRNKFLNRVRQRQLPQTDGTWYGIEW